MNELKDLEFLTQKSNYFIEKQVEAYRNKHTVAGILITVITVFIPLFVTVMEKSLSFLKWISILPLVLLIFCLIRFVLILKTKSLDFGFSTNKFDDLVNKPYADILLFEIGANRDSFKDNMNKIVKVNALFHSTIIYTLISIIISITLITINLMI